MRRGAWSSHQSGRSRLVALVQRSTHLAGLKGLSNRLRCEVRHGNNKQISIQAEIRYTAAQHNRLFAADMGRLTCFESPCTAVVRDGGALVR